jgi:hypothetical protein
MFEFYVFSFSLGAIEANKNIRLNLNGDYFKILDTYLKFFLPIKPLSFSSKTLVTPVKTKTRNIVEGPTKNALKIDNSSILCCRFLNFTLAQ